MKTRAPYGLEQPVRSKRVGHNGRGGSWPRHGGVAAGCTREKLPQISTLIWAP